MKLKQMLDVQLKWPLGERKYVTSQELLDAINLAREDHGNRVPMKNYTLFNKLQNIPYKYAEGKLMEVRHKDINNGGKAFIIKAEVLDILMKSGDICDTCAINEVREKIGGKPVIIEPKTRFEDEFMDQLVKFLNAVDDISIERQYTVNIGEKIYYLDAYIEEYKLAIEYDESHHQLDHHKQSDMIRQAQISEKLGCKFVRLDYRTEDSVNLGIVYREILKLQK